MNKSGRRHDAGVAVNDLLTLGDAAELFGKTPSNISYLVQYNRIRKYDREGNRVERAPAGGLRVRRSELLEYLEGWDRRVRSRMEELRISDTSIAFLDVPERERTKHVHRLHPYLGKFIPQLVGHYLSEYFEPGGLVVDPFSGSGTTLVEATERGIHSVGVEVSEFNVVISRVKLAEYDVRKLEKEVLDIARETSSYSAREFGGRSGESLEAVAEGSTYLERWFAPRSLAEMLAYRDLIPRYEHQDLLRVLLSRTARSCRLVHHYDLATPKEPVRGPYVCYKHKGRTCAPVTSILPRLRFYSADTIRRISEFQRLRLGASHLVVEGDSRRVDLREKMTVEPRIRRMKIDGIFTSPPYVGQIDYHEQHEYAYELFGFERRDACEIGPRSGGKSERARRAYVDGIVEVLRNVGTEMKPGAAVIVVANDRMGLYPQIFEEAGVTVESARERPVEDRTQRDKRPYSETVFVGRLGKR